jgi:hypothetical protein
MIVRGKCATPQAAKKNKKTPQFFPEDFRKVS